PCPRDRRLRRLLAAGLSAVAGAQRVAPRTAASDLRWLRGAPRRHPARSRSGIQTAPGGRRPRDRARLRRRSARSSRLPRENPTLHGSDESGAQANYRAHTQIVKRLAVLVFAAAATACGSSGSSSVTVHPDGRIGPLEIDRSREAQIRDFAGKPFKVLTDDWPGKKRNYGHSLYYRCGRGCVTT